MIQRTKKFYSRFTRTPHINLHLDDIFDEIDNQTYERTTWEQWTELVANNHVFSYTEVIVPPVKYEGKVIKGILYTQFNELFMELYPYFTELFHVIQSSGCCSFSWSEKADGLFTCYENPVRDEWFRRRYPDRTNQVLLPLEESNWTDETFFTELKDQPKEYDLLVINRNTLLQKNNDFMAKVIALYDKKYGIKLKVLMPINKQVLFVDKKERYQELQDILGNVEDYITFIDCVPKHKVVELYNSCKAYGLFSLIEGKNRSLHEAMSCNVPSICFSEFNQYVRGNTLAVPNGAGLEAPFEVEQFTSTLKQLLDNYGDFKARRTFLDNYCGRGHFLNTCLDYFPYYQTHLPEFAKGNHINSTWLDLAVMENYGLSLHEFIYNGIPYHKYNKDWNHHLGRFINYYASKMGFRPVEPMIGKFIHA